MEKFIHPKLCSFPTRTRVTFADHEYQWNILESIFCVTEKIVLGEERQV